MRAIHAIANLVALAVLVGFPLLYLHLCRGTATCTDQLPISLLVTFGAIPVTCFLISATVANLNWNRKLSRWTVLAGALLASIGAYMATAAAILCYEILVRPTLDDAVPMILGVALVVGAWVPLTALWNMVLLARASNEHAPQSGTNAA